MFSDLAQLQYPSDEDENRDAELQMIDQIIQKLLTAPQAIKDKVPLREMTVRVEPEEVRFVTLSVSKLLLTRPNLIHITKEQLPIIVVADLHGQFCDLRNIFDKCGHPNEQNYLFLGDFADRGTQGVEIITLLASLKLKYPERIFLIRGNHEDYNTSLAYGLFDECYQKYGNRGEMVWLHFVTFFNHLPFCALIDSVILCMHGGISPNINSLEDINKVARPLVIPPYGIVTDLLWSDPVKPSEKAAAPISRPVEWWMSPRGTSFNFDSVAITNFCRKFRLDLIIRGHQILPEMFSTGYVFTPCGQMVTIFSAPHYNNMPNQGAVVKINKDLSVRFTSFRPIKAYNAAGKKEPQLPSE